MNYKNNIAKYALCILTAGALLTACQKMDRPPLGDYPKDANPPGGPLKFYTAFDGTGTDPLMNGVDSIRANFPATNPFTSISGVNGAGAQGVDQKAILYPSANDWAKSTSFTIAFWERNSVPGGGSPQFLFSLASKDYWHQSALFCLVDHDGAGSTATDAVVKIAIEDHWFEFTPANGRMPGNLLNNEWHHMAFVYDETTSKMSYYIDGAELTGLPSNLTDLKNGSAPFGPLNFANTYGFVLGGWNKHASLGNGAPTDAWIQSWQGGLDQFRLYNKALSSSEISALYNSKL
ncbi:MAG TPA: LamG domain-containing protein [Panacibacter sp.]|nr:LamG domain-containing protein [Panacibacter sp.]HNP44782.1 LamG domain-containing protein [Panacibacter sp.]